MHDAGTLPNFHVLALKLLCFPCEFETVSDGVGQFLDLGVLVMMCKDDRLALGLKLKDLLGNRGGAEHELSLTIRFYQPGWRCRTRKKVSRNLLKQSGD